MNKAGARPELLAPAGDLEKLKTAIHYGADAVYLGASLFSLRGKAGNFEGRELKDAVSYARQRGARAYVTVNVFAHDRDFAALREHATLLREARPDGVIVSDPGVFAFLREEAPGIDLHVSTQANITNSAAARFWEGQGAKRLILSRELTIGEIRLIREAVSIELEVFVHGSLCISYSGRCYISSFLAGRSANAGECTNSCRWNYALVEEKRQGEYLPVFEDGRGTYLMSPKDLCMIGHLAELFDAGVSAFKIEGRMKGINYVAGVVKTYREAIDTLGDGRPYRVDPRWVRELSMFSSRGYTTGMFLGRHPDDGYNFDGDGYRMTHELVGTVVEVRDGDGEIALRNRLSVGDEIEYLSPGLEDRQFRVVAIKDGDGADRDSGRNEETVFVPVPPGVRPRDLVRRRKAA